MITCLSPNGLTIISGERVPDRLAVATVHGIALAQRRGDEFSPIGTVLADRHIASIWFHPPSHDLFAGSYQGGVYWSRDLGETWTDISGPLAERIVYTVAARQEGQTLKIYAGTEPVALYVSEDYGRTWSELPGIRQVPGTEKWTFPAPPHAAHLKAFGFDAHDAQTFYVCIEQGGLFRTTDGGLSFTELESVAQPDDRVYKDVHRMMPSPTNPAKLFLTGGDGLCTSDDGGIHWRRVHGRTWDIGYPDGLVIDPYHPNVMWISGAERSPGTWRQSHVANAHVAQSRDGGETWTLQTRGLPAVFQGNIEALSLSCTPSQAELYFGTTDGEVYLSPDGGQNWNRILTGLAPISKGGHYRPLVAG